MEGDQFLATLTNEARQQAQSLTEQYGLEAEYLE
jgi:hypothetical protein